MATMYNRNIRGSYRKLVLFITLTAQVYEQRFKIIAWYFYCCVEVNNCNKMVSVLQIKYCVLSSILKFTYTEIFLSEIRSIVKGTERNCQLWEKIQTYFTCLLVDKKASRWSWGLKKHLCSRERWCRWDGYSKLVQTNPYWFNNFARYL